MAVKASDIIKVAKAEVGTYATAVKKCKYNTWFYGYEASGSGYDWCAAFVCWVFNQAGAAKLIPTRSASCGYLAKGFQDRGQLVTSDYKAGDVVFFHWGNEHSTLVPGTYVSNHVGIIKSVNANGTYTTIEGNTGTSAYGAVLEQTRYASQISCAGRPKYSDSTATTTSTTKEIKKIVTQNLRYLGKSGYSNSAAQVKTVQRLLNALSYKGKDSKTLTVDGDFGANTTYAVKAYQTKNKLTSDGIVGPATWKALLGAD